MIRRGLWQIIWWLTRWAFRLAIALLLVVALLRWVNPPVTYLMWSEGQRLGGYAQAWRTLDVIPSEVADAAVAAEDVHFCRHSGFDWAALRAAWEGGAQRGGSTITQQVAKNVFLWPDRSWLRKGLEAGFAGLIEVLWGKRRILEVYLNVAEFGEGVFGIEAGAQAAFGVPAEALTADQAARLMTVLPAPRSRSPAQLSALQKKRLPVIRDGALAVARDARGACYRT